MQTDDSETESESGSESGSEGDQSGFLDPDSASEEEGGAQPSLGLASPRGIRYNVTDYRFSELLAMIADLNTRVDSEIKSPVGRYKALAQYVSLG